MKLDPTFYYAWVTSIVLQGTGAPPIWSAEYVDVEERVSSNSSTPLPHPVPRSSFEATEAPVVVSDAETVVRAAARLVDALDLLPVDPADEEAVDALVARKTAGRSMTPLG